MLSKGSLATYFSQPRHLYFLFGFLVSASGAAFSCCGSELCLPGAMGHQAFTCIVWESCCHQFQQWQNKLIPMLCSAKTKQHLLCFFFFLISPPLFMAVYFQIFLGFLFLCVKFIFLLSLVAILVDGAVCSLLIVLSPLRKLPEFPLACNTDSCDLLGICLVRRDFLICGNVNMLCLQPANYLYQIRQAAI